MKELKSTVKRTGLLASSLLCSALLMAVPFRKELNEGWKFKQARLTNWYPATVPGVIHTDLLANKIIEDPFFRLNERGLQWIDKEDWIFFSPGRNHAETNYQTHIQRTGYLCRCLPERKKDTGSQ